MQEKEKHHLIVRSDIDEKCPECGVYLMPGRPVINKRFNMVIMKPAEYTDKWDVRYFWCRKCDTVYSHYDTDAPIIRELLQVH